MSASTLQVWPPLSGPEALGLAGPADQAERRRPRGSRRRFAAPPTEADVVRMLAEFQARGGQVTVCPVAHAVPVNNGAGRDAQNWTI
jgi:hypothetical protein